MSLLGESVGLEAKNEIRIRLPRVHHNQVLLHKKVSRCVRASSAGARRTLHHPRLSVWDAHEGRDSESGDRRDRIMHSGICNTV